MRRTRALKLQHGGSWSFAQLCAITSVAGTCLSILVSVAARLVEQGFSSPAAITDGFWAFQRRLESLLAVRTRGWFMEGYKHDAGRHRTRRTESAGKHAQLLGGMALEAAKSRVGPGPEGRVGVFMSPPLRRGYGRGAGAGGSGRLMSRSAPGTPGAGGDATQIVGVPVAAARVLLATRTRI
ncbi:hypothetical protein BDZ97DRAFT_1833292 [Flammula alnicola]|nr:hypothetical protein BDZ97DRAFT_1833292 [Flammula alnicola]